MFKFAYHNVNKRKLIKKKNVQMYNKLFFVI